MTTHAWCYVALALYAALILAPRTYLLLFGRTCPHCRTGRLWFGGVHHPWRSLKSWWQCGECTAIVREASFGRLEPAE